MKRSKNREKPDKLEWFLVIMLLIISMCCVVAFIKSIYDIVVLEVGFYGIHIANVFVSYVAALIIFFWARSIYLQEEPPT